MSLINKYVVGFILALAFCLSSARADAPRYRPHSRYYAPYYYVGPRHYTFYSPSWYFNRRPYSYYGGAVRAYKLRGR